MSGEATPGRARPFGERLRSLFHWLPFASRSGQVGVEIGESSIKVVRVRQRGRRVVRIDELRRRLPSVRLDRDRHREAVRQVLGELVATHGLKGRQVAAFLSGQDVVVRRVVLPEMNRTDLYAALALECRRWVKFPIEEAEIRYEVVVRAERTKANDLQLLVAVVRRQKLTEMCQMLKQARLKPKTMTIAAVALRSLLKLRGEPSDELVAYLDLGETSTQLVVLKGDEIRFSRDLGLGGADLTKALHSVVVPGVGTIELGPEKAETLKRSFGIPLESEDGMEAEGVPTSVLRIMFRPTLERLARELWNSFDYCHEQFHGEPVARLMLLGGGSRLRNLPEYLSEILKIPVECADVLTGLGHPSGSAAGAQVTDVGVSELGLGLAVLGARDLNFLSPTGIALQYRLAQAVPHRLSAALAAGLLIAMSAPLEVAVFKERQRIAQIRTAEAKMASLADAVERFRAARGQEAELHDLLSRLGGGQHQWSRLLRELSYAIGPDVRLTALEVSMTPPPAAPGSTAAASPDLEPRIRVSGLLRSGTRRAEEILGELMQSLERLPSLDQVRLETCQTVSSSTSRFSLTARVWPAVGT